MTHWRMYWRYVSASVRGQLQYRASLAMYTVGHLVNCVSEFVAIWALFARFGTLGDWALREVALIYGLVNISFALGEMAGRGFDIFDRLIKSGQFDRYLLRPRPLALQVMGVEMRLSRFGRLSQGLGILVWSVAAGPGGFGWTELFLAVWSIFGAGTMFVGLFALQATMAFWTTESLEVWNAFSYGGNEAGQYPMAIYVGWFRRFFTYVIPLACVTYYPALVILGRSSSFLAVLGPAAGLVFCAVSLRLWRWGVGHYRSAGS